MTPNKMKAIGITKNLPIDNPESMVDLLIDKPQASGYDVLVKVCAVSVNPVDYKIRQSPFDNKDAPKVLGWDAAGIVEEVGEKCTLFKVGDEVYYSGSVTRQGTNSEYHLVDERIVAKKPQTLDFAAAAALPLTTVTAYEGMFERLGVSLDPLQNKGKTILIIAAAGGVGSIAIQLAKHVGLKVIATASRGESSEWVKSLGADIVINHREDVIKQLHAAGAPMVDYIFALYDPVVYWDVMAEAIAPQGRVALIVEPSDLLDLNKFKSKSATIAWEFMFTRSLYNTPDMIKQHEILKFTADLIDRGQLKTTIAEVISPINAANLRMVHKKLESGAGLGKTVLKDFC